MDGHLADSGVLKLWDLLEGRKLFDTGGDEHDDQRHLGLITALLGPPPEQLVNSGRRAPMFYRPDGRIPTNENPSIVRALQILLTGLETTRDPENP